MAKINIGNSGKKGSGALKKTLGDWTKGQANKFGIYTKALYKVTTRLGAWIWGNIAGIVLSLPAVIIFGVIFLALIIDAALKVVGKSFYLIYQESSALNPLKYISWLMASGIKLSLDTLAGGVKATCEVFLLGLRAIGGGVGSVVLAFTQGNGNIISNQVEIAQKFEQEIQAQESLAQQKKAVGITYTEDQTFETERKKILQQYDKMADMLQYSFRYGKYWKEALATGMVRRQQLENYHNMTNESLDIGVAKTQDGSTLLQSVANKAGQIKDSYYWRYKEALTEEQKLEEKIAQVNFLNIDDINKILQNKNKEKYEQGEKLAQCIAKIEEKNKIITDCDKELQELDEKYVNTLNKMISDMGYGGYSIALSSQKSLRVQLGGVDGLEAQYDKLSYNYKNGSEAYYDLIEDIGCDTTIMGGFNEILKLEQEIKNLKNELKDEKERLREVLKWQMTGQQGEEGEAQQDVEIEQAINDNQEVQRYNEEIKEKEEELKDLRETWQNEFSKTYTGEGNVEEEFSVRYETWKRNKETLDSFEKLRAPIALYENGPQYSLGLEKDLTIYTEMKRGLETKKTTAQQELATLNIEKDVVKQKYNQALEEVETQEKKYNDIKKAQEKLEEYKEELRWAKEKLCGVYMGDNIYTAIQNDGGSSKNDNKVNYVMDLYYEDEDIYPQLKESMYELIDAELVNIDNTFNRFVGGGGGFVNITIDEALNNMFQKRYGGYGYPKEYYTSINEEAENILGARVYTYEETAVIAPENLKLMKIENKEAPDGKVVAYMYFVSEDGQREYKVIGLEEISEFFNKKAKQNGAAFNKLQIGSDNRIKEVINGLTSDITNGKSYQYEYVVVPEGTAIGYFGKDIMPLKERERVQSKLNGKQNRTQEEEELLQRANYGRTFAYVFVELNEDQTNAVFDVEADFIIPEENKDYFRYAITKKEREGLVGSRLYGGGVKSNTTGIISKIDSNSVTVGTNTTGNLVSYSERVQKLLNELDPYWNSKYYVFSNGADIENGTILGTNGVKAQSNYMIKRVTKGNGGITSFELLDIYTKETKTYTVGGGGDITALLPSINSQLQDAMNYKIDGKNDILGYALYQGINNGKIERSSQAVVGEEGIYEIEEAGRGDNGLLKLKIKNIETNEVTEYLDLLEFGSKVKNKLNNVFNPNSTKYNYKYAKWDTTQYTNIDAKDENGFVKNIVKAGINAGDVLGFKGRVIDESTMEFKDVALGTTSIIAPEECIITKAGWNGNNGWTVELTSLDYERRYVFSKLSGFSSWIQGILGSKVGMSTDGRGVDWRTSGQYYEIDEYRIINKGEVIGEMGDSGGEEGGEAQTMPLVAPETLVITKIGYKTEKVNGQDVRKYCIDVENLLGTKAYKIENATGFGVAHTAIKGNPSDTKVNLGAYKKIEFNKCKMVDELNNDNSMGMEPIYKDTTQSTTNTQGVIPVLNTDVKEVQDYRIKPLYIYEGETIAYAKVSETMDSRFAIVRTLLTDITASTNNLPSGINISSLLTDKESKEANITDLMAPLHVDVRIEKFDSLIPEDLQTKVASKTPTILDAKKDGNNINIQYTAGDHKVSKFECYDSEGKLIGTTYLEYTPDETQIAKIIYNNTTIWSFDNGGSDVEIGNVFIKADNVNDVAQIRIYDRINNSSNYDMFEILSKETGSTTDANTVKVDILMAKDNGIKRIEYYNKAKELIAVNNIAYNNRHNTTYIKDISKSLGEIDQIKVYDYSGKVAYLKPEIVNATRVSDSVLQVSYVKGHKDISRVEYYNSGDSRLYVEEYKNDIISTQSTDDTTINNAKVNDDGSYTSLVRVANGVNKVAKIVIYDKDGNRTEYKLLQIISAEFIGQTEIRVVTSVDESVGIKKMEFYNQKGTCILSKAISDKDKNKGTYDINIGQTSGALTLKVYSNNDEVKEYTLESKIGIIRAYKNATNMVRVMYVNGLDATNIACYDAKNNKLGEVNTTQYNLKKEGRYDVPIDESQIDKVAKITITDGKNSDDYTMLNIKDVQSISKTEVQVKLDLDNSDMISKIECYDNKGQIIRTQAIPSSRGNNTIHNVKIDSKLASIKVFNKWGDSREYNGNIVPKITGILGTIQNVRVDIVPGINPVNRVVLYNKDGVEIGNSMINNKTSIYTNVRVGDNKVFKAKIIDSIGLYSEFSMLNISSVEKVGNNFVRVTVSAMSNIKELRYSNEQGKWIKKTPTTKGIYDIATSANKMISKIEVTDEGGGIATFEGVQILKAEKKDITSGTVLNVCAKDIDGDGIEKIIAYDSDGNEVNLSNNKIEPISKDVDINIKLDDGVDIAKVKVFDVNGLGQECEVTDKSLNNNSLKITKVTRSGNQLNVILDKSEDLEFVGIDCFDNKGNIVESICSGDSNTKNVTCKEESKINTVTKIVAHARYEYMPSKDIRDEYNLFEIQSVTKLSSGDIQLKIIGSQTVGISRIGYSRVNAMNEYLNPAGDTYTISRKDVTAIAAVDNYDNYVIYYGPNIEAEKVDVDNGAAQKINIQAKEGDGDGLESIEFYDKNRKKLTLPANFPTISGDSVNISEVVNDELAKAKYVRVYNVNGLVGEATIIDKTKNGNKIEIDSVERIDAGSTNYSNTLYKVNLEATTLEDYTITSANFVDNKGNNMYLYGVFEITQQEYSSLNAEEREQVNVVLKDNGQYYIAYNEKIAKISLNIKNSSGYESKSSWYDVVELEDITINEESNTTSLKIRGASTCGMKSVQWKNSSNGQYTDATKTSKDTYTIGQISDISIRIEANNGIVIQKNSPKINQAINVTPTQGMQTLGYSITCDEEIDRIECWNGSNKLYTLKNPGYSGRTEISYNANEIKVFSKSGMFAKKDIDNSPKSKTLKIESVERIVDDRIRVMVTIPSGVKMEAVNFYDTNGKLFDRITGNKEQGYSIQTRYKVARIEAISKDNQVATYDGIKITKAVKEKQNIGVGGTITTLTVSMDINKSIEAIELYDENGNRLDPSCLANLLNQDSVQNRGFQLTNGANIAKTIKVYGKDGLVDEVKIDDRTDDAKLELISIEKQSLNLIEKAQQLIGVWNSYKVNVNDGYTITTIEEYDAAGKIIGTTKTSYLNDVENTKKIRIYAKDKNGNESSIDYDLAKVEIINKMDSKIRVVARETNVAQTIGLTYYESNTSQGVKITGDNGVYIIPKDSVSKINIEYTNGVTIEQGI